MEDRDRYCFGLEKVSMFRSLKTRGGWRQNLVDRSYNSESIHNPWEKDIADIIYQYVEAKERQLCMNTYHGVA